MSLVNTAKAGIFRCRPRHPRLCEHHLLAKPVETKAETKKEVISRSLCKKQGAAVVVPCFFMQESLPMTRYLIPEIPYTAARWALWQNGSVCTLKLRCRATCSAHCLLPFGAAPDNRIECLDMFWCGMNGNDYEWWECHFTPQKTGALLLSF